MATTLEPRDAKVIPLLGGAEVSFPNDGSGSPCVTSEVYAVTREFTEWGGGVYSRLPTRVRDGLRAAGVCHYLVIVKDPSGDLYSFDFGPVGGDVTGRLAGARALPFAGGERSASSPALLTLVEESLRLSPSLGERGRVTSADDLCAVTSSSFEGTSGFSSGPSSCSAASSAAGGAAAATETDAEAASACLDPAAASPTRRDRLRSLRSMSFYRGGREFLSRSSARGSAAATAGEIREGRLDELPEGLHFVGRTHLSLDDIRSFNGSRDTAYSLHGNDCRHYLNDLCAHACPEVQRTHGRGGVASRVAWQSTWGRQAFHRPVESLFLPVQMMADLRHRNTINRIRSSCSASVVFWVGHWALPMLCRPMLAPVGAIVSVLPVASRMGRVAAMPARRLVTGAAAAAAGVSAEVPVVREALMVGNVALTGLTDVARGLVTGTSTVFTAGTNYFFSSSAAAATVTAAATSASCEASAAAAAATGASIVAAGTSRGAAAATAMASSSAAVSTAAAQTQALAACSLPLTVTRVAASAGRVRAVAGRAARATQTIAYAMGAGLKKMAPRGSPQHRLAQKQSRKQKQRQRRPSHSGSFTPPAAAPSRSNSIAGGSGSGGGRGEGSWKVPRLSLQLDATDVARPQKAPRLGMQLDAGDIARAQRSRPLIFSFWRRGSDRAAAAGRPTLA